MKQLKILIIALLATVAGTTNRAWATQSESVDFLGYYQTNANTSLYYWGILGFLGQFSTQPSTGTSKTFSGQNISPFRAYFELRHGLTCGTPTSNVRAFNLSFGDGSEANGIEEVTAPLALRRGTRGETWHTLDGRRLSGQPTTKGLFLRNGRKVIVK